MLFNCITDAIDAIEHGNAEQAILIRVRATLFLDMGIVPMFII